jgi:NADH:ubiquinone oxidoreductase subunit 4 (subunit M)
MVSHFLVKFFILYIFLIDGMLGLLYGSNDLTNYLIVLTGLIVPLTILTTNSRIFSEFLFLLGLILFVAFSTYNLLIWYISFEAVVIPMIYLLSKGSSSLLSRYRAIYRFTLYTILGGLFLLFSLLYMILITGSTNYYLYLFYNPIGISLQLYLFPLILISYLIKLPVIPFHIWLPKILI